MKVFAEAPASSANVGPGFDIFGLALSSFKDRVVIELNKEYFKVEGDYADYVPNDLEGNLVGRILDEFYEKYDMDKRIGITLYKDIPPSIGLGSSAASAVAISAALLYIKGFTPISFQQVLELASIGELYVSGDLHRDNLVASILGGFVIATSRFLPVSIMFPEWLRLFLLIPKSGYGKKDKTKNARKLLPRQYSLKDCVFNIEHAAVLVKGFIEEDPELIRYGLKDKIAEPYRVPLISEYKKIVNYLDKLPILGYFISGAGPSITILYDIRYYDDVSSGLKSLVENDLSSFNYIESEIDSGVKVWVEK